MNSIILEPSDRKDYGFIVLSVPVRVRNVGSKRHESVWQRERADRLH